MKKVFLTGASAGIGRAIAETLLKHGYEIWGTSRDVQRLPRHQRLHPVALDLADANSLAPNFQRALTEAGHFDVLINNAGSGHFGPSQSLTMAELAQHFQILFFAPVELTQLAAAAMRRQPEGGLIINVSSLAARLPLPFMASYNAAKAALSAFTMSLQLESPSKNVRLVDLQPGDIRTDFNLAMSKFGESDARMERVWRALEDHLHTAPPPELVASAVLSLIEQKEPPPRLAVGDFFQSRLAPLACRCLTQSLLLRILRKYYRLS